MPEHSKAAVSCYLKKTPRFVKQGRFALYLEKGHFCIKA